MFLYGLGIGICIGFLIAWFVYAPKPAGFCPPVGDRWEDFLEEPENEPNEPVGPSYAAPVYSLPELRRMANDPNYPQD